MSKITDKLRGLFLATLMVTSVFAGALAFAGTASAATGLAADTNATHVSTDQELTKQRVQLDIESNNTTTEDVVLSYSGSDAALVSAELVNTASGVSVESASQTDTNQVTLSSVSGSGTVTVQATLDTSNVNNPTSANIEVIDGGTNSLGNVSFQFVDANEANAFVQPGATFWRGQGTYFEGNADTTYQIRSVDNDGNVDSLVTEFVTDSNGVAIINTNQQTLENGQGYVITTGNREVVVTNNLGVQVDTVATDGNASQYSWEVQEQTLSAEFEDGTVSAAGEDPTTTVEFSSNRGSYDVTISASDLSTSDLVDIFEAADNEIIARDSDEDTITVADVSANGELTADFSDTEAGDYQFSFEGADTDASATANVSVTDEEGELSLDQSIVTQERGDVAEFTVNLDNTNDGYVQIGSDDVGYNVTLYVDDGGDNQVEVTMNTYAAGSNGSWSESTSGEPLTVADEDGVYGVSDDSSDDGDTVEVVEVNSNALENPLEAGTYDLTVGPSQIEETGVGTLDLQERSTQGLSIWTASGNADIESQEELLNVVNETQSIAGGSDASVADYAIVQVQATGIYGQIEEDNLSSITQEGLSVTIEESEPGANQQAQELDITPENVEQFYVDADNNTMFLVVDTSNSFFSSDESYEATWEITPENPIIVNDEDVDDDEETETASQTFDVAQPEVNFDNVNDNDEIEIASSSDATISGTTNLAVGSEVTIRLRSSGGAQSFLKTVQTTVQDGGSFSATVNMSNIEANSTFTAELRRGGQQIDEDVDGVVVEQTQTETPETETPGTETVTPGTETPGTETVTPGTETATPGGTTTTTADIGGGDTTTTAGTTQQDTPGFGVVVALVALVAAALLAVRRDN